MIQISLEISYYSLTDDYKTPVKEFLEVLGKKPKISVETGTMSTSLAGEYDEVMEILTGSMRELMGKYPSVFCIKISNACSSCKKTS
jgi:uncharacterized protein YqgV (UPF0045/DUF77 family)